MKLHERAISKHSGRSKDRLTKKRRSWNMSRIRGKNTTPERVVRSMLHRMGFRFRLHGKKLPGRPDIVLMKHKTVIFVHGCFWHRHKDCRNCNTPTNNQEFWIKKLEGNAARDKVKRKALRKLGWNVIVIWECQTERPPEKLTSRLMQISKRSGGPGGMECAVHCGATLQRTKSLRGQAMGLPGRR